MSARTRAAGIIAKRQIFEDLISPGFYIALSIGLLLGYFLVSAFTRSVDSSGFNPRLNPLYDGIGRALEGAFGGSLVDAVFAEGPLPFALAVSFLPVFLYVAVSSVFKLGLERNAGAVELVVYGPADGTSYLLASYARDLFLSLVALAVILVFSLTAGAIFNDVAGPSLFLAAVVAFFLSLALYAYGIFSCMVTANPASSLALFMGTVAFFLVVLFGSFAIVGGYVRTLSVVVASAVQWISPFYYGNLSLQANAAGDPLGCVAGLALLAVLSAAILVASHFIIRARGVRA